MDFVEANDVMLAYEVFEARGPHRAPPLILMRGLGTQMIQWHRPLIDSFTAQGMDVVIFDNRDVGRSTKLDAAGIPDFSALAAAASVGTMFPVPYTLDDMARDVVGLMDGLDMPKANFFGISMGGMVAQHLAFSYAVRFEHIICVMSSSGGPDVPQPDSGNLEMPDVDDRAALIEYLVASLKQYMGPGFPMSDADCLHMAERIAERGYYPPGIARQYAAIMADGSRVDRLRDIALPFFVIHGDHDSLLPPPCGEDIVKNVQLAQWLLVDGMGHDMGPGIEAVITPAVCAFMGLGAVR
ncbi:MAG: alpha/beta hydrolase [Pseudomonadota bacterium]|nr:alpha/beta hydrolase [Pseudomonadota bacterium]